MVRVLDDYITREQIFPLYESMLKDSESEIKFLALKKVAELFPKLETIQLKNILSLLISMSDDPSMHIRSTLPETFSKLSNFLTTSQVIEDILPVFYKLLDDEIKDVKCAAILNMDIISDKLCKSNKQAEIFKIIEKNIKNSNWQCRFAMVEGLPKLINRVGFEKYKKEFIEIIFLPLHDHYFAIREQAIKNIQEILRSFEYKYFEEEILYEFERLIAHKNYIFRVTSINLACALKDLLPKNKTLDILDEIIDKFKSDSVPNVRLKLAQLFELWIPFLEDQFIEEKIVPVLKIFLLDSDSDVIFYTKSCISKHNLSTE